MSSDAAKVMAEIDEYVQHNRYAKHSFVQRIESGEYTKEALRDWAVQKYFQTREQNCVYAAVHSNAQPYRDIRAFEVEQLIDEETDQGEGSAPHYELIKRLSDALGAEEKGYDDANIGAGVRRFVTYLMSIAQREHPVIGMLCTYINEAQTPESARRMYQAIKRDGGLGDYELEWFTVHAGADVEHSRKGRDLIVRHAYDLPDFADRAWWTVERGITEWRALHDFYYDIISTS